MTLQRATALSVTPVWREGWVAGGEKRETGVEVTDHDEGLRNTTERH